VGGYVAAIKAGQEGMKVHPSERSEIFPILTDTVPDMKGRMYRKARSTGGDLSERRLYTFKVSAEQFAFISSNSS
jgi:hypothetical protein